MPETVITELCRAGSRRRISGLWREFPAMFRSDQGPGHDHGEMARPGGGQGEGGARPGELKVGLVAASPMPAAEVDVSPELVAGLLAAQHPDPALPLPVPAPVRAGQPGLGYPWPWSIVPFLPGRVAAQDPPADPLRAAVSLGTFLAALHVEAPPDAPANVVRGVPLSERTATVAQNLVAAGDAADREAVLALWEACVAAPKWSGPPVWVHGDLHPANILVHEGHVSGVIDFGDLTSGDPAADLSVAWMLLPAGPGRDAFRAAYLKGRRARSRQGLLDQGQWLGARALAGLSGPFGRQLAARRDRPPHDERGSASVLNQADQIMRPRPPSTTRVWPVA